MWDPAKYLAFADQRGRPFAELVDRIGAEQPRSVVDLGCGPGNLTEMLARRWPRARIEALDSSPEMVDAARERGIDARVGDVSEWHPRADTDVVVCNAVLQWVPDHAEKLRTWARELPCGAWLAWQVPGNFAAPSHLAIRELAGSPQWRAALADVALRGDRTVLSPREYADLMADEGCQVDAWETTYVQQMCGEDPILEWVTGTALRPIRAALDDEAWQRFRAELAPLLRSAYPARADGVTWFGFRRIFAVARVPSGGS